MYKNDESILSFLDKIAELKRILWNIQSDCKQHDFIKKAELGTSVYGGIETEPSGISLGLNGDLKKPIHDDFYAIGLSFMIKKVDGLWVFEGEVGFSSYDYGFEDIDSIEISFDTLEMLLEKVIDLIHQLSGSFGTLLKNIEQGNYDF